MLLGGSTTTKEFSSESSLSLGGSESRMAGSGLPKSGDKAESPKTSEFTVCDCCLLGSGGTGGGKALNSEL